MKRKEKFHWIYVFSVVVILGLLLAYFLSVHSFKKKLHSPKPSKTPVLSPLDLANEYARRGKLEKAIDILQKAINENPKEEYFLFLAHIYEMQKKYEKALKVCQRGINIFPDSTSLLEEMSTLQITLKRYEDVVDTCSTLLLLLDTEDAPDPDILLETKTKIATAFGEDPKNPKVRSAFKKMMEKIDDEIKSNPKDETLLKQKAEILRFAKKYDEAIKTYQKVNEVEKKNLFVPFCIGRILMEKGDLEAAKRQFQKTLSKNPQNFRAYRNFGWYWRERGKKERGKNAISSYQKALYYYKKALELSPLEVDKSYHRFKIAQVFFYMWKETKNDDYRTKALNAFRKYKELVPDWIDTSIADKYINILTGKTPEKDVLLEEDEKEITPAVK